MQSLWIYPEDTEVLGVACKSFLGDKFHALVLVNEKVMQEIGKLSILAPLHNPANLAGIEFVQKAHPHIPQIAVFDTAFHATMPNYAYMICVTL